ncbi:MAG TPA: MASE1 domain-containing protein [Rhodopila sp.]
MTPDGVVRFRNVVIVLSAYAGSYLALDWISFFHVLPPIGFTLWNPPPACSLALLMLRGLGYAPALIVVSFVSDGLVAGFPGGMAATFISDTVIALGYTVVAATLRRFCRFDLGPANTANVTCFLLVAMLGVLVIAGLVSATFVLMHVLAIAQFASAVVHFWIGDLTGIVGLFPGLVYAQAVRRRWHELTPPQRCFDIAVFLAGLALALYLVFGPAGSANAHLFYLLLLPVVWIAVRHGLPWSAVAVFVAQLGLIVTTSLIGHSAVEFFAFQLLSLTISGTGLLVGAVVTERRHAEDGLRQQQAELERMTRLTTAGALGMAVVHQISQPLATIATYTHACRQLLRWDSVDQTVLAETMAKAEAEVLRAGVLVDRLRDFLSNGHRRLSFVDLAAVTQGVVTALTDNARRRGVRIEL